MDRRGLNYNYLFWSDDDTSRLHLIIYQDVVWYMCDYLIRYINLWEFKKTHNLGVVICNFIACEWKGIMVRIL